MNRKRRTKKENQYFLFPMINVTKKTRDPRFKAWLEIRDGVERMVSVENTVPESNPMFTRLSAFLGIEQKHLLP